MFLISILAVVALRVDLSLCLEVFLEFGFFMLKKLFRLMENDNLSSLNFIIFILG